MSLSSCKFFKDYKLHSFVIFEKFTRTYLHQIALEIILFTDTNKIN